MAERVNPGRGRARDGEDRAPGRAPRPVVTALTRLRPRVARVALLTALAFVATPVDTNGQLPVIDAANLVQNTLTALKTIESVINEVQMIANQVRQLETMVQNTKGFSRGLWDTDAQPRLLRLGAVIDQERAIAYTMANVDGLFRQRYPGYHPVTD